MASKKAIENSNRLRYIRALERFHKSIVSYLGSPADVTKEGYDKKCSNALKLLQRVEEVPLYKGDFQDLQKLVSRMIAYIDSQEDVDEIKQEILYASNQLDKTKNNRKYKKEKHSKAQFKEWE